MHAQWIVAQKGASDCEAPAASLLQELSHNYLWSGSNKREIQTSCYMLFLPTLLLPSLSKEIWRRCKSGRIQSSCTGFFAQALMCSQCPTYTVTLTPQPCISPPSLHQLIHTHSQIVIIWPSFKDDYRWVWVIKIHGDFYNPNPTQGELHFLDSERKRLTWTQICAFLSLVYREEVNFEKKITILKESYCLITEHIY